MKLRLILGIIIPLIIIITLIILGTWPSGFSINKNFNSQIDFNSIFNAYSSRNAFRIGEIEITNDYFLSKRIEAPIYLACLYDENSIRPLKLGGNIIYNEGEASSTKEILDLNTMKAYSYYEAYPYRNKKTKINVKVPAYTTKKLQVYFLGSNYYYNYKQTNSADLDYDYLILIEIKNNKPSSCEQISSEDIKNSLKIKINKPENICIDEDNRDNLQSLLSQSGIKSTCTQITNSNTTITYEDYCIDSKTLGEYICSGDNRCIVERYTCPDSCLSGRCTSTNYPRPVALI